MTHRKGKGRQRAFLLLAALALLVLTACAAGRQRARYSQISDFNGAALGLTTGATMDNVLNRVLEDVTYHRYGDSASLLAALRKGEIDAAAFDRPAAVLAAAEQPELAVFPQEMGRADCGYMLAKGSALTGAFSRAIEELRAGGVLAELEEKWLSGSPAAIDWDAYRLEGRAGGTLRFACDAGAEPLDYLAADGRPAGFEVELLLRIADALDMGVELLEGNASSLLNMVQSGRADVAAGGFPITEERRAVVDFPAAHYACTIVLLCRAGDLGLDVPPQAPGGPFARLAQGLEKTLLREGRWKLIAQGLAVTLEITFCAALAGTALGFGLYLVRRSRCTPARRAAEALCTFLQGVPGLVVLMALYFVVFGSVRIRPAAVGSLTFAILFAVTVSGILSAGIGGVDKGQWEAAGALGFGRAGAFFRVILPRRRVEGLHHAFEEIAAANIVPRLAPGQTLHILTEYAESADRLEMRFLWGGAPCNPLEEGEPLSLRLVKAFLAGSRYDYAGGENRLTVQI